VNLTTGRAFRGALLTAKRELLVLGNAQLLEPGQDPIPVSGTVCIERALVEFVQVVN
jgi:hypothetical protein